MNDAEDAWQLLVLGSSANSRKNETAETRRSLRRERTGGEHLRHNGWRCIARDSCEACWCEPLRHLSTESAPAAKRKEASDAEDVPPLLSLDTSCISSKKRAKGEVRRKHSHSRRRDSVVDELYNSGPNPEVAEELLADGPTNP